MKNKRLLDIFGEIDDRHIAEAAPLQRNLEISQFGLDGVQSLPAWS